MEEIEVSVEGQQEAVNETASEAREKWLLHCALIAAVLAVAAAICGLYSAHFANEAMIEQLRASDQWSYYQSKGIKAMLTELQGDLLTSEGKPVPDSIPQKISDYHKQQDDIKTVATEASEKSETFLKRHEKLAVSVTCFQIAIAITAMAAICRRKKFLILTAALALIGTALTVMAANL